MNMKNLTLCLSSVVIAVTLTGCGGGGGDSSSSAQVVTPQASVTADYTFIVDDETLETETIRYINGGTGQVQYRTTLGPDSFLLTPSKLYNNTWVDAVTRALNEETLTFSSAPGTLRTETLKKVDVSGQDIFSVVYPGYREYFKFLNVNSSLSSQIVQAYLKPVRYFPAGSVCYRTDKTTSSQGYIRFEQEDLETRGSYQDMVDILPGVAADWGAENQWTYRISGGTWAGHEWKYVQFFDQYGLLKDSFAVVNNQGKAYYGEMYDFENYSARTESEKVKALLADTPAQTADYYLNNIMLKYNEQGCSYYNNTAAKALNVLR